MPELPEVETVRRILEPQLAGQRIRAVRLGNPQVIARPDAGSFCRLAAGQTIRGLGRRGKFLSLELETGACVVIHLRMTGSLVAAPADYAVEKHTHVTFLLESGSELRFTDPRRFGRLWLLQPGEPDLDTGRSRLGPEPFSPQFDAEYLQRALARRKRPLKECLLDQSIVAGIGNIYADEILFAARLSPMRPANTLTKEEAQRLAAQVPQTLQWGIDRDQMTPQEYLAGKGRGYRNAASFQVYGRGGAPCRVCGQPLRRVTLGGRSSVYCPCCQGGPATT